MSEAVTYGDEQEQHYGITDEMWDQLQPWVTGPPDARGEVPMHCVLHEDANESASYNINSGHFCCHAGCGGTRLRRLIDDYGFELFKKPPKRSRPKRRGLENGGMPEIPPSPSIAWRWHRRLMNDEQARDELLELRGIEVPLILRARLGYDGRYFKLPIFGPGGKLWNIRTYDTRPRNGRRKIWGMRGHNRARLYPYNVLAKANPGDTIVVCEGEWDALLVNQAGYRAVTRTGAAKVWEDDEWSPMFKGLRVFVCHDRDETGFAADRRVAESVKPYAYDVKYLKLPYRLRPKDGKDLTDFLLDVDEPGLALGSLMDRATHHQEA